MPRFCQSLVPCLPPLFRRGSGRVLALALALAWGGRVVAQETPAAGSLITTVSEFWNMSEFETKQSHRLRMELTVLYYDPEWKLIYGETKEAASYLPVRAHPLPMQAGQKVLLEGRVVPAEGIDGELVTASVLAEGVLPVPLPTAGRIEDVPAFNGRWVEMDGYVLSQNEPDPTHIEARLWCEGLTVHLTLQISGTEPVPQLVGARVRVRGVYDAARDPLGKIQRLQLWSGAPGQHLKVLGWLGDDGRFKLPRTLLEQLEGSTLPWVRVVGELRAQDPGKSLTIRDETGQIVINTTQPEPLPAGTTVEVVGRPVPGEVGWTLQEPLFRKAGPSAGSLMTLQSPGQSLLRLRLAQQVLELPPEQAEKKYPVTLRGVVTWAEERADFFFVQDVSGGVRVRRQPGQGPVPAIGASVVLNGLTVRGAYVPEVELVDVTSAGTVALPPVRGVNLEQALSGAEEGQRVEMRGYVRQVVKENGWSRLDLTTFTGEFSAYLPYDDALAGLKGALVRVRGVCTALTNANRELVNIKLWMQNREAVVVDEPRPADPFTTAVQPVASLRQFTAVQLFNHRVRLAGMVLLHEPGRYLYLQDESGGLLVLTREPGQLNPGDWVEIVGFPGRVGNRLVMREAIWRPVAPGPAILAESLPEVAEPQPRADARLVQLAAVLRQVVAEGGRLVLTLQAGDTVFAATLHSTPGWIAPDIDSRLELTGVYVLEYDEYRQPHGFRLELRNAADVRVIASPSWWTVRRSTLR